MLVFQQRGLPKGCVPSGKPHAWRAKLAVQIPVSAFFSFCLCVLTVNIIKALLHHYVHICLNNKLLNVKSMLEYWLTVITVALCCYVYCIFLTYQFLCFFSKFCPNFEILFFTLEQKRGNWKPKKMCFVCNMALWIFQMCRITSQT